MSPAKVFARIDTLLFYQPFLHRLIEMVNALDVLGAEFVALDGFRKMSDQAQRYFQGRTIPGRIVTHALPGYSAHLYGLACDFGRFFGSHYSEDIQDYDVLGDAAERCGLVWGGRWHSKDAQHVQFPKFVTASQLQPLKDIYDAHTGAGTGWLNDVWAYVLANQDTNPDVKLKEGTT